MRKYQTYLLLAIIIFLSNPVVIKAQVNTIDSLALVDLYNSTNGPEWAYHDNWLKKPVKKWYGIGLTGNGKRIKSIKLSQNNLTGLIPSSLGNLANLSELYLNDNQLSGNIPPDLGNLSNLIMLYLGFNQLSGNIPPELGKLSNLSYLDLSINQLSGNIPPEVGNLSNLKFLQLDNNQLSGTIPPEFGNLLFDQADSYINLSHNQLNGHIPPELGKLSNLEFLYLNNNQLSGNIPPELGNLFNLTSLYLYNNQLSGSIPPELGKLSNLYDLFLYNNQLSGNIPPELGNLSNLKFLYLDNNQLSGNIPPQLGNLSAYDGSLDLSHNQLSGHIPTGFDFYSLCLSYNKLQGRIPDDIGNSSSLHYLFLDHNRLSGAIPLSIVNLTDLDSLDLSYNRFTFNSMEFIATKFPFAKYNNQARINLYTNNNALSVSAGGTLSNNTYIWYKKGEVGNTTIAGDSVFHPTQSGVYFVKVKNAIATQLKLFSDTITYTAPALINAVSTNKQLESLNKIFSVYPNPAKIFLYVKAKGNVSISLLSQAGDILLTENINSAGSINIAGIAAGVYYVRDNNTKVTKKINVIK